MAIIALLIALLLPTLKKAREAAQAMQCLSLLKQFGLANVVFAEEHKGHYLPARIDKNWPGNSTSDNVNWYRNDRFRELLSAEPKNYTLRYRWDPKFLCPNSGKGPSTLDADGTVKIDWYYGYNVYGVSQQNGPYSASELANISIRRCNEGVQQEDILRAAMKVMFADALFDRIRPEGSGNYIDEFRTPFSGSARCITSYRHGEQANVAYFDGHAAVTSREELYPSLTPWKLPD